MDISLVAAKILGTYLTISGLFLLFRGKTVPHLLKDFFDHPAIVYLAGIILIFLSSLLLVQDNVWDGSWRTVVTVLAWRILIKGLFYLFAPEALHRLITKKALDTLNLYGLIAIIFGLSLFYIS